VSISNRAPFSAPYFGLTFVCFFGHCEGVRAELASLDVTPASEVLTKLETERTICPLEKYHILRVTLNSPSTTSPYQRFFLRTFLFRAYCNDRD
jgi:hypothetical protein